MPAPRWLRKPNPNSKKVKKVASEPGTTEILVTGKYKDAKVTGTTTYLDEKLKISETVPKQRLDHQTEEIARPHQQLVDAPSQPQGKVEEVPIEEQVKNREAIDRAVILARAPDYDEQVKRQAAVSQANKVADVLVNRAEAKAQKMRDAIPQSKQTEEVVEPKAVEAEPVNKVKKALGSANNDYFKATEKVKVEQKAQNETEKKKSFGKFMDAAIALGKKWGTKVQRSTDFVKRVVRGNGRNL